MSALLGLATVAPQIAVAPLQGTYPKYDHLSTTESTSPDRMDASLGSKLSQAANVNCVSCWSSGWPMDNAPEPHHKRKVTIADRVSLFNCRVADR